MRTPGVETVFRVGKKTTVFRVGQKKKTKKTHTEHYSDRMGGAVRVAGEGKMPDQGGGTEMQVLMGLGLVLRECTTI